MANGEIEAPFHRRFIYKGEIFQDLVFGHYKKEGVQDGSLEGKGEFLLKIESDIKKMTGFCAWYDKDSNQVETSSYEWTRE